MRSRQRSQKPRTERIRARINIVIEWLTRADPERPFLVTDERVWSYGVAAAEVEGRISTEPLVLRPNLSVASVFDVLAGIAGAGAAVLDHGLDADVEPAELLEAAGSVLVVFTSGTTGRPKGVRLTSTNLEAAVRASMEHLGHGPADTWLLTMPISHVGGLSILLRSAYVGGSVRLISGFVVEKVIESLESGVTMVSVVPTMLRRLLDRQTGPHEGLRAVLVGGGPIPEGLLEEAAGAGLPVLPTYGMTETFGQVATLRPGAPLAYHVHPLPGVELRIEPDGRIALRGDQVSPGYLGEPDRPSDWLITSDVGTIENDGALRVLGRADWVIVTGGENVDPVQVEELLSECPGVRDLVVVGIPSAEWGMAVACVYEGEAEPYQLAAWARGRLSGFMVPKMWRRVDSVPRTALGKPDRLAAGSLF